LTNTLKPIAESLWRKRLNRLVRLKGFDNVYSRLYQSANPNQVEFTWQDNSQDANASANDKVLLVVFNPAKQLAITIVGGNDRSSGSQVVEVPATFAGDEVQCYIAFQTANQSVLSNSVYAGPVVVYD